MCVDPDQTAPSSTWECCGAHILAINSIRFQYFRTSTKDHQVAQWVKCWPMLVYHVNPEEARPNFSSTVKWGLLHKVFICHPST